MPISVAGIAGGERCRGQIMEAWASPPSKMGATGECEQKRNTSTAKTAENTLYGMGAGG